MRASRTRFDPNWILVVLLAVFAVAPLTYPGFFQAQSGFLPAFNAAHISDAPTWGMPPGYVDAVRGEGQLPYLLVQPVFWLTGSGVVAVKWGYGLAFVLGALGVYAWTRRWLGRKGGLLAAVVYTYLPWHLSTVYVRGAYAEAWLWALWPFLLWALDRLGEQPPRSILTGIAVGLPLLAATFWTQPGLAALACPLLVAYSALVPARRLNIVALPLSLILLWFTASRATVSSVPFAEYFLYPFQLFSAAWGDGPAFQLGLAAVGLSIVAVALWTARKSEVPASLRPALWFWLGALLVLALLTLPILSFFWRITGLERLLTYPWQLLALVGTPLAFLAGSVLRLDERLATLPAWAGLVALVVLASYPYLAPSFTQVDPGPEPVALLQPVEAAAPQIVLLDYEIAPPTEITPTLTLTLTWQAIEPVSGDYTVFVHALRSTPQKGLALRASEAVTADGETIAQRDSRPCDGDCPTDTWQPGEIVIDRHELALNPDAPPGPYRLAVGLYLLESGERAPVLDRDDKTVYLDVK